MIHEWNHIGSELPEADELVLAFVPGDGESIGIGYWDDVDHVFRSTDGQTLVSDPTHWMAMPDTPEGACRICGDQETVVEFDGYLICECCQSALEEMNERQWEQVDR